MVEAVSAPLQIAGNVAVIGSDRKVHIKNFQTGKEVALSQDQFKKQLVKNADKIAEGETVNFKKPKVFAKVLAGLAVAGAITAGVVYRKNIGNFFKGLKDVKFGEFAETAKKKAGEGAATVKEKAGKWYNKAADWVVDKWHKGVDFFKGLSAKPEEKVSVGVIRNEYLRNCGNQVVKDFNVDNSTRWLNTFKNRYSGAAIEVMPRK